MHRKRIITTRKYRATSLDGVVRSKSLRVGVLTYASGNREQNLQGVVYAKKPSRKRIIRRYSHEGGAVLAPLVYDEKSLYERVRRPWGRFIVGMLALTLNSIGIFGIGHTAAAYFDNEGTDENTFIAGSVDFVLSANPFDSSEAALNLHPSLITIRDYTIAPEFESNPFRYIASSTDFSMDLPLCEALQVEAELLGESMYSGPLQELMSLPTTTIDTWEFMFEATSSFQNKICMFNIDFNGWQTRHDFPNFEEGGFSDTETIKNTIHSWGLRINKVYFEKTRSDCDKVHHSGYKDNGKKDCDADEEEKETICHATSSEVNPWVRLVVNPNAFNGHFEENGTPLAGHEEDILLEGDVECPLPDESGGDQHGTYGGGHKEDSREMCACGDPDHGKYGDDNEEHCNVGGDITIININDATTTNDVSSDSNTGGNSANGGEGAAGGDGGDGGGDGGDGGDGAPGGTIETGDATSTAEIENNINQNFFGPGGKKKDNEWVEIYNQTDVTVDISGWHICDDAGCDTIPQVDPIPSGGFAMIAGNESTFGMLHIPSDVVRILIVDGVIGGDGLPIDADMLILARPDNIIIDQMNWGIPEIGWPNYNTNLWDPGIASTSPGSALARNPTGFDTDQPSDWTALVPPMVDLVYPDEYETYTWFWFDTETILWDAINNNGPDGDLTVDIYYIKDANFDGKLSEGDTVHTIVLDTENDGAFEWEVPLGFIGYIWIKIVVTGPENVLLNDKAISGRIFDPVPVYLWHTDPEEVVDAILNPETDPTEEDFDISEIPLGVEEVDGDTNVVDENSVNGDAQGKTQGATFDSEDADVGSGREDRPDSPERGERQSGSTSNNEEVTIEEATTVQGMVIATSTLDETVSASSTATSTPLLIPDVKSIENDLLAPEDTEAPADETDEVVVEFAETDQVLREDEEQQEETNIEDSIPEDEIADEDVSLPEPTEQSVEQSPDEADKTDESNGAAEELAKTESALREEDAETEEPGIEDITPPDEPNEPIDTVLDLEEEPLPEQQEQLDSQSQVEELTREQETLVEEVPVPEPEPTSEEPSEPLPEEGSTQ